MTAADPRDVPGDFAQRVAIDVRFADTDAMGHVNNAVYLTYCEMARIRYWSEVTGEPLAAGRGVGVPGGGAGPWGRVVAGQREHHHHAQ